MLSLSCLCSSERRSHFIMRRRRRMGHNHLILLCITTTTTTTPASWVDRQSPDKWYSPRPHHQLSSDRQGELLKNMWIISSVHGIFPHLVAVVFLHCFHHTNDVGLLQYGCILSNGGVLSRINIDSKCKLSEGWATYITLFWGIYLWGLPAQSIHTNDHYDVAVFKSPSLLLSVVSKHSS